MAVLVTAASWPVTMRAPTRVLLSSSSGFVARAAPSLRNASVSVISASVKLLCTALIFKTGTEISGASGRGRIVCFNFKAPDPELFAELAALTRAGAQAYSKPLVMPPREPRPKRPD